MNLRALSLITVLGIAGTFVVTYLQALGWYQGDQSTGLIGAGRIGATLGAVLILLGRVLIKAQPSHYGDVRFTPKSGHASGSAPMSAMCQKRTKTSRLGPQPSPRSTGLATALLAGEIHPHLRFLVLDRFARDIHQGFLHRAGERERRLVVGVHDRRAGIGADADARRQAQLSAGSSPANRRCQPACRRRTA